MKVFFLGIILSFSFYVFGDSHRIPKGFSTKYGQAIFVDFQKADYFLTYNLKEKKANVRAEIDFIAYEEGYPIFDSVTSPVKIFLDNSPVTAGLESTPSGETKVRVIGKNISPGAHRLIIEAPIENLVEFEDGGVKSAFWTSDLSERQFLERYVPASFEFDQVKMNFLVEFVGASDAQKIYTNGELKELNTHLYSISFPEYFNASSVYFHTTLAEKVVEKRLSFESMDGREIPVTIYIGKSFFGGELSSLKKVEEEAFKVFHELEKDYGPWPHPVLVIYNAGRGGMEYCGATITEFRAIGHELFHSYFARGVMPANGNAGWVDEALASWRDNGHQKLSSLSGTSGMSNHPYYTRVTDRAAYSFGEKFMRLLENKFQKSGGLKPFLKYLVSEKLFDPLSIEEYILEMERYFGESVRGEFLNYTFNSVNSFDKKLDSREEFHPKMSQKELQSLL